MGESKAALIIPLTVRQIRVLEIGCGTGEVLAVIGETGCICTGVEVSQDMLRLCHNRGIDAVHGTADHTGFPANSFDLVFSQEVLEHLHPEDVPGHFAEAYRLLRPKGILAVETPNRRTGPQDVSRGFARVAEGLHLKEWTVRELLELFHAAGFVRIRGLLAPHCVAKRSEMIHRISRVPGIIKYCQDLSLAIVPGLRLRTILAKMMGLDDVFLFAEKSD